jgi:uncharacterized protein
MSTEHESVSPPPPAPPQSPPPAPPQAEPGAPSAEEKQWAMFAHLSALAGVLLTSVLGGWGTFIGPLVIWLVKKDTMPFVASQAKEALNFNIMVSAIFLALFIFTIITFGIGALLAFPVMLVIGLAALIFTIIAAIKANDGIDYRYPVNIRLIK